MLMLRLSHFMLMVSPVLYPVTKPTLAYPLVRSCSKDGPPLLSFFLSRTVDPRTEF
jgi:hypothetical protein